MPYYGSIEITDAYGWNKNFALEKTRIGVGSAPFNDLALSEERGGGVAPAHLQLFYNPAAPDSLRVVNLDRQPVQVVEARGQESAPQGLETTIPGSATGWVRSGDRLVVGDFCLEIQLTAQAGINRTARSEHIGLALELPSQELRPDSSLRGRILLSNYGQRPSCQINLVLEGLPTECYRIEPAPLLYPGGQEFLSFAIQHCGSQPPAGPTLIRLRASAPKDYPSEEIVLDETLMVEPCFGFRLDVKTAPEKAAQARLAVEERAGMPPVPTGPAPAAPAPATPVAASPLEATPVATRAPESVAATSKAAEVPAVLEAITATPAQMEEAYQTLKVTQEPAAPQEQAAPPAALAPPAPPPAAEPEPFIRVVAASQENGQDWFAQPAASPSSPPPPVGPVVRPGRAGIPRRLDLARQNITVLKADAEAEAEALENPPPSFDEEEEETEEST
jgi:hypothetical protein